jgi:tRNA isopentenyl-2-thiomethyl-A-37 hydroxylase MiaE
MAKQPEKRVIKTYKVKPKVYAKCMRRAKKEKTFVTNIIEMILEAYAEGKAIVVHDVDETD